MNKRWKMVAAGAAVAIAVGAFLLVRDRGSTPEPAPAPALPLPGSIAAIGDSITAGVGASPEAFEASPQNTWATGSAQDDVLSHYERLLAAGAAIEGQNHNFAAPGATMADGPDQARRAVSTGAAYVTILLGGNDVCSGSIETMTPLDDFERDFRSTLGILSSGLPQSRFFVVSIPDVHQLWEKFHEDAIAPRVWDAARTCGAMLDPDNTESDREAARQRSIDYNSILGDVCAEEPRCRFDNGALFDEQFGGDHVAIDFFHPSHVGHRVIADLTWTYGYWPDL